VNLGTAQGEAMQELARLAEAETKLRARIDEISRQARAANEELVAARESLVELERQAGTGKVSAQARKEAEQRLDKAEQAAAERWAERRAGAERAATDGRHAIQRHVAENFDEIMDELEEIGAAAAEGVNRAAESFLDACTTRIQAEQNLTAVAALARQMRPGDVVFPKSDAARLAVAAMLQAGGEVGPALREREPVPA
jgi:hypothetical protein